MRDSELEPASLALVPEVEARRLLAGVALRFRVLAPPYPALGTGRLRVVRVRERDGVTELLAGYDGYVRP